MTSYELPSLLILPFEFLVLVVCKVDEGSCILSAADATIKVEY